MYNHNKAQQNKNRVHISWDILYNAGLCCECQQARPQEYYPEVVNEAQISVVLPDAE